MNSEANKQLPLAQATSLELLDFCWYKRKIQF